MKQYSHIIGGYILSIIVLFLLSFQYFRYFFFKQHDQHIQEWSFLRSHLKTPSIDEQKLRLENCLEKQIIITSCIARLQMTCI
jgi:hypothetical protein